MNKYDFGSFKKDIKCLFTYCGIITIIIAIIILYKKIIEFNSGAGVVAGILLSGICAVVISKIFSEKE